MSRFARIFLLSMSSLLIPVSPYKTDIKIKFVNDILANENVPSAIVVKATNWSKNEMVRFSKFIDSSVKVLQADGILNHSLDEYSNKIWFFIDMTSEGSREFVLTVKSSSLLMINSIHFLNYFQADPQYYGHPYRWILFDISEEQINALKHLHFLPDSNILLVHSKSRSQLFNLQQSKTYKIIFLDMENLI